MLALSMKYWYGETPSAAVSAIIYVWGQNQRFVENAGVKNAES